MPCTRYIALEGTVAEQSKRTPSVRRLTSRGWRRLVVASSLVGLAFNCGAVEAQTTSQDAVFTYQGRLVKNGAPFTGSCDMKSSIFDSVADATGQIGLTETLLGVQVTNGLWTALLNSSGDLFGQPRDGRKRYWLQIAMKCGTDGGFTTLAPRQLLTGAPFTLGLKLPFWQSNSVGTLPSEGAFSLFNTGGGFAIHGSAVGGSGVIGVTQSSFPVAGVHGLGHTGVYGQSLVGGGTGVYGHAAGEDGARGVLGSNGDSNTVGYAGYFLGRAHVTKDLTVAGTASAGALKVAPAGNGTTFTRVQAGTTAVGNSGTVAKAVTITFPFAFTGVPKLTATPRNEPGTDYPDAFIVSTRSVSATQAVVNIVRVDTAVGWGQALLVDWLAWE
jgi:hypothetical protein